MMPNQKNIMTRYSFIILMMVLIGIAIICKAGVIMFAERQYWKDVADRFVKENVTVRPTRGNIISSDGQLMASSLPEYKIYMDFKAGGHLKDSLLMLYMDSICDGLHQIFPDKSKAEFKSHILKGRKKGSRNYLLYPKRISYIQYKEAKRLPVFNLNKYKGGFHEQAFNQRKKPFGSLAMRTLGDMYPDIEQGAKNGLELSYDSILKGREGITHRQKVMNKYLNIVDIPPVDGCDIITTIDVGMQDIAEKALVDKLKEINATVGVAILMEVQTGEIKAIVNMTKCADGVYREIRNNAVSDMMEPGSTFKTASIMVALEDGKITPDQTIDTGNGVYNMHGARMKDHNWHRGGYGVITTTQTLMYSSNIGVSRLIDQNYHDHPEKYVQGLYKLGIASPLHLDIPGAGDPFGAGGPFGGFYGRYTYNNAGSSAQDDNPKVRAAGNFISNGYYNEALKVLEEVPFAERRGRWYYYSAIANQKLGNTATAIEHIQRAVSLEPNNMQYRQFMQIIENGGSWYSDMGDIYGRPSGRGSECCSLLATFLCWQMFCC